MRLLFIFLFFLITSSLYAQRFITKFESSGGKETPAYSEVIAWWKTLDAASPMVRMQEMGTTDAGFPLHLVMVSADKDFHIASLKKKKKNVILVMNGIHPGEPDGIDASMLLVRDYVQKKDTLPSNVVLAIIPVYNIGGALNRSPYYRINQNGPEQRGFRGNSQNLDLNRDFIKADSKEAISFTKIFHYLDPDVFIDNHVTNGADYQHIMTLIASQHNKLGGAMGTFMKTQFEPGIYSRMKEKGYDLVPYVNHSGRTPDEGWAAFWDSPRYSSGYATLWHTFAFVPETHMLKPYPERVAATKALMQCFVAFTDSNSTTIQQLRRYRKATVRNQQEFPLRWKLDSSEHATVTYRGYEAGTRSSAVSGLPQLFYNREKPFVKEVPFYNNYADTLNVQKPVGYLIPQGWWKVIDRLNANNIPMKRLARDTVYEVEWYRIGSYHTTASPFEGHYLHYNVQVQKYTDTIHFRKGDYYIALNTAANRFLIETLEPHGEDSYFAWNFFDPVLRPKEGFSSYVFEETAAALLASDPALRARLEERRSSDSSFAGNAQAQLQLIYQHSPYYEPAHLRYPVYRVMK